MPNQQPIEMAEAVARVEEVERRILGLFAKAGWRGAAGSRRLANGPDLEVRRAGQRYSIELILASEGRADRLIPLWSQAYLELSRYSHPHERLVVVSAPRVSDRVAEQLFQYAHDVARDAAVGVLDDRGLARFRGKGLANLDREPTVARPRPPQLSAKRGNLFSDLNQWMLKVLLAPDIPEHFLHAPRGRIRNARALAQIAGISPMSAHRFVGQLRAEGFLANVRDGLILVRKAQLFDRWKAAARQPADELALKAPLRLNIRGEIRKRLAPEDACLGLFAAAAAHRMGHVHGVPPYVLVRNLDVAWRDAWSDWIPVDAGEADVILRQPAAPKSAFNGVVIADDVRVCDIIQVWLDVAWHPSRGEEQAALIFDKLLSPMIRRAHD